MEAFDTNTLFSQNPDVVYTQIDDEIVLMGHLDDQIFGTNTVGAEIWKLLEAKPMCLQEISRHIEAQFEVDEKQVLVDTRVFLEALLAQKLVVKTA